MRDLPFFYSTYISTYAVKEIIFLKTNTMLRRSRSILKLSTLIATTTHTGQIAVHAMLD